MGYNVNSPIKQIWLPLNNIFINNHDTDSFKAFSESYRERYGIDLHDIFELSYDSNKGYCISLKNNAIGAYSTSDDTYFYKANIAVSNAILEYNGSQRMKDEDYLLVRIGIKFSDNAMGFDVKIPKGEGYITIDELLIFNYEI